jgi:hypothetical protein
LSLTIITLFSINVTLMPAHTAAAGIVAAFQRATQTNASVAVTLTLRGSLQIEAGILDAEGLRQALEGEVCERSVACSVSVAARRRALQFTNQSSTRVYSHTYSRQLNASVETLGAPAVNASALVAALGLNSSLAVSVSVDRLDAQVVETHVAAHYGGMNVGFSAAAATELGLEPSQVVQVAAPQIITPPLPPPLSPSPPSQPPLPLPPFDPPLTSGGRTGNSLSSSSAGGDYPIGGIVGGIVGGLVGAAVLVIALLYCFFRQTRKANQQYPDLSGIDLVQRSPRTRFVFGPGPLGFGLSDAADGGVFIAEVHSGGAAEQQGMRIGCRVLTLAGIDVRRVSKPVLAQIIARLQRPFELTTTLEATSTYNEAKAPGSPPMTPNADPPCLGLQPPRAISDGMSQAITQSQAGDGEIQEVPTPSSPRLGERTIERIRRGHPAAYEPSALALAPAPAPAPPARPVILSAEVIVPDGAVAGEDITFTLEDGRQIVISCPDEAMPGDLLEIDAPILDETDVSLLDARISELHSLPAQSASDAMAAPSIDEDEDNLQLTETVEMVVPDECRPGDFFFVEASWGGLFEVEVPPGTAEGSILFVELPRPLQTGESASGAPPNGAQLQLNI